MTLLHPTHVTYRRIDAAHDYRPGALNAANDAYVTRPNPFGTRRNDNRCSLEFRADTSAAETVCAKRAEEIDPSSRRKPLSLQAQMESCARCGGALCDCFDAHWTPRVIESARNTGARPQVTLLPKQGPGAFSILLHANPNSAEAQHDHG